MCSLPSSSSSTTSTTDPPPDPPSSSPSSSSPSSARCASPLQRLCHTLRVDGRRVRCATSAKQLLLDNEHAVYTGMRTVGHSSVLLWQEHVERMRRGLNEKFQAQPAFTDVQVDTAMRASVAPLLAEWRATSDVLSALDEIKLTLIATCGDNAQLCLSDTSDDDNERDDSGGAHGDSGGDASNTDRRLHMLCAASLLESGETRAARGAIRVLVADAQPRRDPSVKSTAWVREREALERVQQWPPDDSGVPLEEVLLAHDARVFEGLQSNFMAIERDGRIVTAPLADVLPGTVQRMLAELCVAHALPLDYRHPCVADVDSWRAAFLTSSSRGVLPIDELLVPASSSAASTSDGAGARRSDAERVAATPVRIVKLDSRRDELCVRLQRMVRDEMTRRSCAIDVHTNDR